MTRLSELSEVELAEIKAGRIPGEPIDLPDCGYQRFDDAGDLNEDLIHPTDAHYAAGFLAEVEGEVEEDLESADVVGGHWFVISVQEA